ncbi:hypothetical protein ACFXDF_02510 [Streptomyces sp. NPDC059426]|uniref:hypothetical protein n=1 Tax=Streptomyces sp. NPDC059426 TaxID=3346827 RepID=UPI0036C67EDB
MSATSTAADQSLLEMIAADERALLHTGAVARDLLARHSDLPLHGARLKYGGEIHLKAPTADDVRAWAARLDADVTEHTDDPGYSPFRHTDVVTVIDGIRVHIWHCRVLSEAEAAAWRENRGQS